MNRPRTGKKKARRITYIISVVFGFIGIFIIIKGFRDMYRKIDRFVYFDRIVETRNDTLVEDALGNHYYLKGPAMFKFSSRKPQWVVLEGKARFEVKQPVYLLTPDTIRIFYGKGFIESGRFPEIQLEYGKLEVENQILEGKNIHRKNGKTITP
ncbi:MAG: hypothetical protein GXO24_05080 [Chlorobi bacterium]|nr:hypothetical protein [Chlorobiota bacterium]